MLRKMIFAAAMAAVVSIAAPSARAVDILGAPGGLVTNASQLGAFAVTPYLTDFEAGGGDLMTVVIVTNALNTPEFVELIFIDGESKGSWGGPSLPPCLLSPRETTIFRFTPQGDDTRVDYECTSTTFDPSQTQFPQLNGLNNQRTTILDDSQVGFFGVLHHDAAGTGTTANPVAETGNLHQANAFVVDWTVVDYAAGEAYSAPAWHFQTVAAATDGKIVFAAAGDVSAIPAVQATNVIMPDCSDHANAATCDVDVEFIFVPLDGMLNEPPPQRVNLDVWNDDEVNVDRKIEYECFDIVRLAEVDSRFLASTQCPVVAGFDTAPNGCVGHVEMTNLRTPSGVEHDAVINSGNGDNFRTSATVAWVIHRFRPNVAGGQPNGEIVNYLGQAGTGIANRAATARMFLSGVDAITPQTGDMNPTLNVEFIIP